MGRTEPTVVKPPQFFRRHVRSKQARATVNKSVPDILKSCPRARRGIDAAELIVDPPRSAEAQACAPSGASTTNSKSKAKPKGSKRRTEQTDDEPRGHVTKTDGSDNTSNAPLHIRLQAADTLEAAALLAQASATSSSPAAKQSRIAILNMASPLRPGGGLFNGATSQEESLCMRTTLYPSLQESFYRLPEIGGIYTPDVLVFRHWNDEARDLDKKDRFFVDVISAGMLRFPDLDGGADGDGAEGTPKRYAYPRDRELVISKMRAVLRIARAKGVGRLVLGAWGCGAYGNPVGEIARAWQTALRGGGGKKRTGASESWGSLEEVVFAVKDGRTADEFAACFSPRLVVEELRRNTASDDNATDDDGGRSAVVNEMRGKIAELEAQMCQSRVPGLKARTEAILAGLKSQLADMTGPGASNGSSGDEEESEEDRDQYDLSDAPEDGSDDGL
ncbi:uncharacterized protein BKA78DRAFT_253274 [Phyllosticta capitalensis]|uniref:uncharacterized protein n=1 Tax=Phyllosticta capitalensis TaxID=121624 RepID=UPI003131A9C3